MYGGGQDPFTGQIATGLEKSLQGMDAEGLARNVRTTLTPKADAKPGAPRLDLVVLCHPRDLDKAGVVCLFAESVKGLKGRKDRLAEAREMLDRLVSAHPDDLSVLAASAILAGLDGNAEGLAAPLDRLARLADAQALEPLPANGRANARQREEAMRQFVLWVVAREALKHDSTRSNGEKLATRAQEAARRQLDNRWTLAMLREAGQDALDRGDRTAAEASWRAMLKMVMTNPVAAKPSGAVEIRTAVPGGLPALPSRPTAAAGIATSPGNSVITLERFEQVAQLARLAADHDLTNVSIEALRDALAGGPPVTPLAMANSGRTVVVRRGGTEAQLDPVAQKVEEHLFILDSFWVKAKADPVAVYEVYREAVLPKARPNEIFLYARPLSMASLKLPRSVGVLLVRWAVKAGQGRRTQVGDRGQADQPARRRAGEGVARPARIRAEELQGDVQAPRHDPRRSRQGGLDRHRRAGLPRGPARARRQGGRPRPPVRSSNRPSPGSARPTRTSRPARC